MNFHVGTSGYSYPEWKGTFYPPRMPAKQMLGFYADRMTTVEINNTFYRPPTAALLKSWADQVPAGFRFVLKAPQEITHRRRLADVGEPLSSFVEAAGTLGRRLGPLLFQLPPYFRKDVPRLRAFLDLLPPAVRAAFEFRHPSWFDDDVFEALREYRVGLCLADADDDLVAPFVATADWGYVRLRRAEYDDAALNLWSARMKGQLWSDCYVFFKHEDAGTGPRLAARLMDVVEPKTPRAAA